MALNVVIELLIELLGFRGIEVKIFFFCLDCWKCIFIGRLVLLWIFVKGEIEIDKLFYR